MVLIGLKKDDLAKNLPAVQERVMDDLMHVAQRLAGRDKGLKPLKAKDHSDLSSDTVKTESCASSVKTEPCVALVPVKEEQSDFPGPENNRPGGAWVDRWEDQHMAKDELVRCGVATM